MLESAASTINSIRYAIGMDGNTISPSDVLYNGPRSDILPDTRSKLRSINSMVEKLKKHKTAMSKIRDDQLHYEWKKMEEKKNRTGLNVGRIMPTIGVLIRTEEKSNYNKSLNNY